MRFAPPQRLECRSKLELPPFQVAADQNSLNEPCIPQSIHMIGVRYEHQSSRSFDLEKS